jgi:hypothetical protein
LQEGFASTREERKRDLHMECFLLRKSWIKRERDVKDVIRMIV